MDIRRLEHRKQLINSRKLGNDNGENVILDQDDGHDQAQPGNQVTHGGGVRAAPFIEHAKGIHV